MTIPLTEKRYICFQEVWEAYGIGRKSIAKLVRDRQLHRRKVGKAWRYSVDELERLFSGEPAKPRRMGRRRSA